MADTALIVGVGSGLGAALARRFVAADMAVAVASRSAGSRDPIVDAISASGGAARGYECDATDEDSVEGLFSQVAADSGAPRVVVFNAGTFVRRSVLETTAEEFEACWKVNCLGGFLVGRAAARALLEAGQGTILFTGATAALRGGANFVNLAVGKFGLRALAQSMARELGSKNIHVAHVVIDGMIMSDNYAQLAGERGPDSLLSPDAIAENYYQLHVQPRSAWTQELDLRPWVESF